MGGAFGIGEGDRRRFQRGGCRSVAFSCKTMADRALLRIEGRYADGIRRCLGDRGDRVARQQIVRQVMGQIGNLIGVRLGRYRRNEALGLLVQHWRLRGRGQS